MLFSYYRQIQKALTAYKDEKRGPTLIAIQAVMDFPSLTSAMPVLADFPLVPIHIMDSDNLYNVLDWQRVGSKVMLKHFQVRYVFSGNIHHKKVKHFLWFLLFSKIVCFLGYFGTMSIFSCSHWESSKRYDSFWSRSFLCQTST